MTEDVNRAQAKRRQEWLIAIPAIVAVVVVATLLAYAGSDGAMDYAGMPVMYWCVIVAFAVQWLFFVHAWMSRSEGLFDLVGSITYITLFWLVVALSVQDVRNLVLAGLVTIWGLRLGPFLFFRIRGAGEDRRFRSIKTSFPTFLRF